MLFPIEIKSAATFSTDFLKGLDRFRGIAGDHVGPGTVLYNGEQEFNVRGVRILNPLGVPDIWKAVTVQQEQNHENN